MGLFGRRQQPEEQFEMEASPQLQPPSKPQSVAFETVLGPGTTFKGTLGGPGSVRLEGIFVGELELEGNALVGEHARITADICAANVTIAGAVRGNISGQRVQLLRTGCVWGNIEASSISTEEGAFIRGTITMKGGDVPPVFGEMAEEIGASPPPIDLSETFESGEMESSEEVIGEVVGEAEEVAVDAVRLEEAPAEFAEEPDEALPFSDELFGVGEADEVENAEDDSHEEEDEEVEED